MFIFLCFSYLLIYIYSILVIFISVAVSALNLDPLFLGSFQTSIKLFSVLLLHMFYYVE